MVYSIFKLSASSLQIFNVYTMYVYTCPLCKLKQLHSTTGYGIWTTGNRKDFVTARCTKSVWSKQQKTPLL